MVHMTNKQIQYVKTIAITEPTPMPRQAHLPLQRGWSVIVASEKLIPTGRHGSIFAVIIDLPL